MSLIRIDFKVLYHFYGALEAVGIDFQCFSSKVLKLKLYEEVVSRVTRCGLEAPKLKVPNWCFQTGGSMEFQLQLNSGARRLTLIKLST